jgi:hypothetical protein
MHPINKKNFGAGKIKVWFHNGTALVTGYIVKQLGVSKYVVTDGAVTKTLTLAPTAALADILTGVQAIDATHTVAMIADYCTTTVTVGATAHYAKRILSKTVITVGGTTFSWTLGTPAGTVYAIAK